MRDEMKEATRAPGLQKVERGDLVAVVRGWDGWRRCGEVADLVQRNGWMLIG